MTISPAEFMARAPKPFAGNSAWAEAYALTLRRVVIDYAAHSPRTLQTALGPSEIGTPCDRQVVGKLAGLPQTNHIVDPWASIVGTALHAWFADAFRWDNEFHNYVRWLAEFRVYPHLEHPGTGDLYDFTEQACVDHKGIAADTPIPTPGGWTTMRHLTVGDLVFGSDGKPYPITHVYPINHKPCYRITFDDGSTLITDDVQEWNLEKSIGKKRAGVTLNTITARSQIFTQTKQKQRHLRLYNTQALQLPTISLPIEPYVLGVWLGDGSCSSGTITKPDSELYQLIEQCGYKISSPHGQRKMSRTIYGLANELQKAGLLYPYTGPIKGHHGKLAGHKTIPMIYLRAGQYQRLELLRGLMDTDGTWNIPRKQAVYTTTTKSLAYSVAELINSLGWKAKVYPQLAHRFGITTTAYHVTFVPYGTNPFKLSRKANLVRIKGSKQASYRIIQSIEPTISVPTRCIDVSSPNHLYLVGTEMLPTHNCLGDTPMKYLRDKGPPRRYFIQLLAYARGFRLMGLPVRRIVIVAWPRTKSRLDNTYVYEHLLTPEDDILLDEVFMWMQVRKAMAEGIRQGQITFNDIHAVPSDEECYHCPFFRADVLTDPTATGCAGHHLIEGRMKK
jgi:LAGLIDADG-like domain